MNIRIDPVNETGAFDNDTYSREDYDDLKSLVLKYLKIEGFTEQTGTYQISLLDCHWAVHIK